jgi:transcriptional regulator with XRE-family HTH domain
VTDDICKRIGDNIRNARLTQARTTTQQMLADKADCDRRHIVALENGQREAGVKVLARIADALSVPIGSLFE